MAKDLTNVLPVDRPYTELEAVFSLQLDHNAGNEVSVAGYAKLWTWTRRRVRTLFRRLGIEISYPEDTTKKQNQRGVVFSSNCRTDQRTENGQISFIDFKQLQAKADRKRTDQRTLLKEVKRTKKKNGVSDPRIHAFDTWFHEKFKHKFGREYTVTNWSEHRGKIKTLVNLGIPWEDLLFLTVEFLLDDDEFLSEKAGHNLGTLLTRINQNKYSRYLDLDFRKNNAQHLIAEPAKPEGPEQQGLGFTQ